MLNRPKFAHNKTRTLLAREQGFREVAIYQVPEGDHVADPVLVCTFRGMALVGLAFRAEHELVLLTRDGQLLCWQIVASDEGMRCETLWSHDFRTELVDCDVRQGDRTEILCGDTRGFVLHVDVTETPRWALGHGHTDAIVTVRFDGVRPRFVSTGRDRKVRVWNIEPVVEEGSLSAESVLEHLETPQDGEAPLSREDVLDFFSVAMESNAVEDIEVDMPAPQKRVAPPLLKPLMTLSGLEGWALAARFSHDGTRLIAGGMDNGIYLWSLDDGRLIASQFAHYAWVVDVEFSPDDSAIVSASWDTTIGIFDGHTLEPRMCLEVHTDYVSDLTFVGENTLFSSGYDQRIGIWDWRAPRLTRLVRAHGDWVEALALWGDGVLSVSSDGTMRAWTAAGELVWSVGVDKSAGIELGAAVTFDEYVDRQGASAGLSAPVVEAATPVRYRDQRSSGFAGSRQGSALSLLESAIETPESAPADLGSLEPTPGANRTSFGLPNYSPTLAPPVPKVAEESPAPVVVEELPAPAVVEESPAPAVVEESPAPVVVEESPAPAVVEESSAPAAVEESPAPAVVEESHAPAAVEESPAVVEKSPAPAAVEESPAPAVVEESPAVVEEVEPKMPGGVVDLEPARDSQPPMFGMPSLEPTEPAPKVTFFGLPNMSPKADAIPATPGANMTSFGVPAYTFEEPEAGEAELGEEISWPVLTTQPEVEEESPPEVVEVIREPTRPRVDLSKLKASLAKRAQSAPPSSIGPGESEPVAKLEFAPSDTEFDLPVVGKESPPDFDLDVPDFPETESELNTQASEQTHAFFAFNTPVAFLHQPDPESKSQTEAFPRVRTETTRKTTIPRAEPEEPLLSLELGAESTKPGTKASDEPALATAPGIFDVSASELLVDRPKPTASGIIRRHKRTEVLKYVEHFRIRTPHQWVHAVAYNPQLGWFASCGGDNTVCVWSVHGELLHKFRVDATGLNALCFSPDGMMLAAGGDEGVVHIWLLPQGDTSVRHAMLRGHTAWITGLAFSSNARILFSSSYDGTVRLWNLEQGTCEKILIGHEEPVSCVSAHLGRLTSAGHDGTLRLWNNQGIQVDLFDGFDKLLSCATNGVINAWCAANGEVFMSEEGRPRPLLRHRGEARAVKILDDGTIFSIGEDGFVMIYPKGIYEPQQSVRIGSPLWSIDAYGKFLLLGSDDGLMHIYSLQTQ